MCLHISNTLHGQTLYLPSHAHWPEHIVPTRCKRNELNCSNSPLLSSFTGQQSIRGRNSCMQADCLQALLAQCSPTVVPLLAPRATVLSSKETIGVASFVGLQRQLPASHRDLCYSHAVPTSLIRLSLQLCGGFHSLFEPPLPPPLDLRGPQAHRHGA